MCFDSEGEGGGGILSKAVNYIRGKSQREKKDVLFCQKESTIGGKKGEKKNIMF